MSDCTVTYATPDGTGYDPYFQLFRFDITNAEYEKARREVLVAIPPAFNPPLGQSDN